MVKKNYQSLCFFAFLMLLSVVSNGCKKKEETTDLSYLSDSPVVLAGDDGFLAVLLPNGGTKWTPTVINTNTKASLKKIAYLYYPGNDYGKFVVVGDSGVILYNADKSCLLWEKAWIQNPNAKNFTFYSVKFLNRTDGLAVAWDNMDRVTRIFETEDGGLTWNDYPLSTPITVPMYAMNTADTVAVVAGQGGTYSRINIVNNTNVVTTLANTNTTPVVTEGNIYVIDAIDNGVYFLFLGSLRPVSNDTTYAWTNPVAIASSSIGVPLYNGRFPNTVPQKITADIYAATTTSYVNGVADSIYLAGGTNGFLAFKEENPSIANPTIQPITYPNQSPNDTIFGVDIAYNQVTGNLVFFGCGTGGLFVVSANRATTALRYSVAGYTGTIRSVFKGRTNN
ncbi:MAG: hypothetical protein QM528_08560 [Phycisphaerales bacterium]|nr:hypothetical protein [Phycisphaerales bacterium]